MTVRDLDYGVPCKLSVIVSSSYWIKFEDNSKRVHTRGQRTFQARNLGNENFDPGQHVPVMGCFQSGFKNLTVKVSCKHKSWSLMRHAVWQFCL